MKITVRRGRGRRNLRMHFNDRGELIVSAPLYASQREIDDFITSNRKWIEENFLKIPERTYKTGSIFPFFGKDYPLFVLKGQKAVFCREDALYVFVLRPDSENSVKKTLYEFYCTRLEEYALEKIPLFCSEMGLKAPHLKICNAKTRWGCCYRTQNLIKLSAVTASLPPRLVDMTIAHELCHLVYDGHGEAFKSMLSKYVPDLKKLEKEIREISKSGKTRNLF